MSFELSELAKVTADYINTTDRHIFLTGKAGTGKTTFLKYIVANSHKKTVVAAPTGIAAINAEGVTLHSLLQLPFGAFIPERVQPPNVNAQITTLFNLFSNLRFNASKRNLINEIELLIIDEVSMLRADLLDCIDHMLRFLRKRKYEPFGGLQMLFIGDLLQLPPVVKDNEWQVLSNYYGSSYFFEAHALKDNPPINVELDKVYRQSDQRFINILNRFRENEQSAEDISALNQHFREDYQSLSSQGYIHLTTHNRKADEINTTRLAELTTKPKSYRAKIQGEYPENLFATADSMELKEGAQVMFIKNDPSGEGQFFNGKIGHITRLEADDIRVTFEDGNEVQVPFYIWENKRYTLNKETNEIDEKVLGSFEQYPLKLAWAVTVHKSQGLTFEKAILDLTDAFAQGQVYVALSRLTSLEGLVLSSKIPESNFDLSESMKAFAQSKASVDSLSNNLASDRKQYLQKLISSTFNFGGLIYELQTHERSFDKQENRSAKQQHHIWTKALIEEVLPVKTVGDSFVKQAQGIVSREDDYLQQLTDRVDKATAYFTPILSKASKDLKSHDANLKEKTKLKTYRKELKALEQAFFNKVLALQKVSLLVKSMAEDKVLTKEDLEANDLHKARKIELKVKKKDKTPTAEISFNLYKEGKTIEEIAEARSLVPSTIESHLCQYVETGDIDPFEIVDKEKLNNILSLITPETSGSGEIKAQLGDEYSWGEVKMGIVYYRLKNLKKD
ncbi:helix-turn-helix domain-containing protein [Roseivirga sp. E12]|uniref:helix-turn-helix domain-containing protein n=1 Tax=Roseivirga sp. E12 TaxID=2819237 RepID=UPI001ABC4AA1|nr:helix-turn-helix domain-containing protein [Roseivirga sp. E12]MBO3700423.1 helix-turn-helix domain-containing protein [Roseivirga sp. E12]